MPRLAHLLPRGHLLTCLSLLSSAAGFLSQLFLAKLFGASASVDAYFFSLGTPIFLGGLVAGAINFYLTPRFRAQASTGHDGGVRLEVPQVLALAFRLNLLTVAAALFGAPLQYWTLPASSVIRTDPNLPFLLLGAWLFAGCIVHQSTIVALLTSKDRLLQAALLPLFPPLMSMAMMFATGSLIGVGSILTGQLLGSLAAIVYGASVVRETRAVTDHQSVSRLIRLVLSGLASAAMATACFTAYPLIDSLLAPRAGPSIMSQMSYAQRVIIGLGTLLIAAPLAVLANRFSDLAQAGNRQQFLSTYRKAMMVSLVPVMGLTLLLIFAGENIVGLMLGRGKFGPAEVHGVGLAARFMAPGMLLMLLTSLTFRAVFALRSGPRSLALVGPVWVVTYASLGIALLDRGIVGLATAYSFTWLVSAGLAVWILLRCTQEHFTENPS